MDEAQDQALPNTLAQAESNNLAMQFGPQPWMNPMGMMRAGPLYQPPPQLLAQTQQIEKERLAEQTQQEGASAN